MSRLSLIQSHPNFTGNVPSQNFKKPQDLPRMGPLKIGHETDKRIKHYDIIRASQCPSTSSQQSGSSTASQTTGNKRLNLKQCQHAANLAMVDPRCFPSQRPASQAAVASSIGSQIRHALPPKLSQLRAVQDSFKEQKEFSANWLKNNSKETKMYLNYLESKSDTMVNHVETIVRQQTELMCSVHKAAEKAKEENFAKEASDVLEKTIERVCDLVRTEISRVFDEGLTKFFKAFKDQLAAEETRELVRVHQESVRMSVAHDHRRGPPALYSPLLRGREEGEEAEDYMVRCDALNKRRKLPSHDNGELERMETDIEQQFQTALAPIVLVNLEPSDGSVSSTQVTSQHFDRS